jgi:F-type H+-transporting ATPase subunit gamma
MPTLRQIRRRIRSIQNTAKVTRAMEMVAATKMRRAQQATLAGRPYAQRIQELTGHLAAQPLREEEVPPLLRQRPVRRVEVVLLTPDRGLCGALPANLNRTALRFLLEQTAPTSVIAVGRKGRDFMARYRRDLRAVFTGLGDRPTVAALSPIVRLVVDDFTSGYADAVYLIYPQFVNTMVQRPVVQQLLPVAPTSLPPASRVGYIYEPRDLSVLLSALLLRYLESQIYHAVLESLASEHSARMVAMRNATENAKALVQELTLLANKVRQESITKELLDIIGGTWALRAR